jgi:hypothetical protein
MKSKEAGYPVFDEVEMIQWLRDKRHKPTEQVRFLPEGLLEFNDEGECIAGQYREAYLRFRQGKTAPGMPLRRWDQLSISDVASLEAAHIFTVEQFAETPREKIEGKYPEQFILAHEQAIDWVRGSQLRESSLENAKELERQRDLNEQLLARVAELEKQTAPKKTRSKAKAKKGVS